MRLSFDAFVWFFFSSSDEKSKNRAEKICNLLSGENNATETKVVSLA